MGVYRSHNVKHSDSEPRYNSNVTWRSINNDEIYTNYHIDKTNAIQIGAMTIHNIRDNSIII